MFFFVDRFNLEDEGFTFLGKVENNSPTDRASYPERPESSTLVMLTACYLYARQAMY
jgi:hypothetical protein